MRRVLYTVGMLTLAAPFLCSCATSPAQTPTGPSEYREGYAGGCDSGSSASGNIYSRFTKDPTRYASDPMYKQGWDDGFATCKGRGDAVNMMLR
jgi:hypothetical protein